MAHIVTLIPGDGTGPEITEATRRVLEATGVQFNWDVQQAGIDIMKTAGTPLPPAVLDSIRKNKVAIKGPITTPIGTGFRSVNVALRKELDLYACLRPCKSYKGVRQPLRRRQSRDRAREHRGPVRRHRVREGRPAHRPARKAGGRERSKAVPRGFRYQHQGDLGYRDAAHRQIRP